jgi:cyclopropane fatty-acyl-phospholipid synthase-like methyltransferase
VLDVGCGTGRLLELIAGQPEIERVGIELNRSRAEFARRISRCEIHEVPIEKFECRQPFDVIFMMNVFSHVHIDPFFSAVHRLLQDQGKLILKVGEVTRTVSKHATHDWGIPDHLHFLGMRTASILAQKYGFRITRHDRWPHSQELFAASTWQAPGRSRLRNLVKRTVAGVPGALPVLAKAYELWHGQTIYTSLIVMQK